MATPGPMADQAFQFGQVATVTGTVLGIGLLFWLDFISLQVALMALFLGLPVVFIIASCLLGVWLGYNREPLVPVVVTDQQLPWTDDERPRE